MARQTFRADSQGRQTTFDVSSPGAAPRFGAQPATGLGLPGAPALQAARPLDFSGVSQVLQGWQQQARERAIARQTEEAAQRGAEAQLEAGAEGVAETPEDLRRRHEVQAFEAQAQAVYNQQVRTDALRKASELQLAYPNNPSAFESAWREYTDETVSTVGETNAVLAAEIGGYLDDVGNRSTISLMEAQHADNLEREKAAVLSSLNDARSSSANIVLNTPTAQVAEEQLGDLTLQVKELADQGILSGSEVNRLIASFEKEIAQNYVTGRANQAFADGDFDAVQLLVDELRTGVYFDDNNEGNRLADRFEKQAGVRIKQANAVLQEADNQALGQLGSMIQSAVERGGSVTPEALEQAEEVYEKLSVSIFPESRVEAQQLYQGLVFLNEYNENFDQMGMQDFASLEFFLTSPEIIQSDFPDSARRLVLDSVRTNQERVADAFSAGGDPATGGSARIAQANWDEVSAEDRVENARLVAQRSSNPFHTSAFYTTEQIQGVSNAIRSAGGDATAVSDVLHTYLEPYRLTGQTPVGVRQLGEVDSEVGGIAMLAFATATDGDITEAADFINGAVQGLEIGGGPTVRMDELSRGSRAAIEAISETNGLQFTATMDALQSYVNGLVVTEPDRTRGGREIRADDAVDDLLGKIDVTTLSNGVSILTRELGARETEQAVALETVEGFLSNPDVAMFGVEHLRPVPMGNGVYAFRRKDTGIFLREAPTQQTSPLLTANVGEEEVLEAQQIDQETHDQNILDAQRTSDNALMLAEQPHNQFREAGQLLGMSSGDVEGFFRALSLSPARSIYRLPNGIAPEVLTLTDEILSPTADPFAIRQRVRTPEMERALDLIEQMQESVLERSLQTADLLQQPLRGPGIEQRRIAQEQMQVTLGSFTMKDNGRLATLVLFNNHLQDFNGDRAKALAAIAAGRSEVDDAIEIGGAEWLSLMDEEAQKFVAKGMRVDD